MLEVMKYYSKVIQIKLSDFDVHTHYISVYVFLLTLFLFIHVTMKKWLSHCDIKASIIDSYNKF
jgi:hypothetical protein